MTTQATVPLRRFVYRTLVWRLSLVTLVLAVALATVSYLRHRYDFEQRVTEMVDAEFALLDARARQLVRERRANPTESVRLALAERLATPGTHSTGRFVYVRVASPHLAEVVELTDPEYPTLAALRAWLSAPAATDAASGPETRRIAGRPHVRVTNALTDSDGRPAGSAALVFALSDEVMAATRRNLRNTLLFTVGVVLATSALLYPVILRLVRRLAEFSGNLLDANLEALRLLGAAIAKRDSDTDAHNYRVTLYSVRLAEALGLAPAEIRALLKGAFLHDVGKIGIRDEILLKPGRLSADEFTVMRTHVDHGLDVVRGSPWLADAATVVGAHHEKFDGSGYPSGARGADIPVAARVFAIADVFDALTSRRPYKEPLGYEQSVAILEQGSGNHFDPQLLDTFLGIAPELYRRYGGREDDSLKDELTETTRRYFQAGLDTLAY
jgi:HD-GYP domain-containing protein (c-di-GMP phosphodiesterase class II)